MNSNTKKKIAREILYFFSAVLIAIIAFGVSAGLREIGIYSNEKSTSKYHAEKAKRAIIKNKARELSFQFEKKSEYYTRLYDCSTQNLHLKQTKSEMRSTYFQMQKKGTLEAFYDELATNGSKKHNSISDYIDCLSRQNINSGKDLNDFVEGIIITHEDSANHTTGDSLLIGLTQLKKPNRSYMSTINPLKTALLTAIILALILYGLRPIYFVIKWSLKTLKD